MVCSFMQHSDFQSSLCMSSNGVVLTKAEQVMQED